MKNLQTFIIGLLAILLIGGAATANAATWTVTKSTNSSDNVCDADCSLREAVFNADSGDTVVFNFNFLGQTFTLGGSEIVITKRITIDGFLNNPNVAFISGSNTSRIFYIQSGAALELRNATLVQGNGGGIQSGFGGAVFVGNNAALSLERVAVRANQAQFGGAVYLQSGTHHFTNSSLTGNASEQGTAILAFNGAIFMSNTTVSGNFLNIDEPQTVGCGAITTRNVNVKIRNSTIANNSAKRGGGICVISTGNPTPSNKYNIGNTIIAGNMATLTGQDILYTNAQDFELISAGGNLIQDLDTVPAGIFTAQSDITGVNPLLGPINANLGDHPIQYHSLQAGSPARNGGLNANAVDPLTGQPLTTDTRGAGFPRITDTTVDIGAFEDQSGNTSLIVTKDADTNDLVCDDDCSLREAVYQAGLNFGTETITFVPNLFGVITLGSEILIDNQSVNIVGYTDANILTVSGGNANRIFYISNSTVKITGMTLAEGNADNSFGGAILAGNSNLTLDRTILRNNTALVFGAIDIEGGTARILNSTISNNSATSGLAIGVGGTLQMANTTVSNNNFVSNNAAKNFGFTNFGAIVVTGTANIRNSSIAFNRTSSGTGGGIYVSSGVLTMGNTIVSNNIAASSPDIHKNNGAIISVGGNLVQNPSGFPIGTFSQNNDAVGVNPLLGALAANGGYVKTHSLLPNSPAINTGRNSHAVDPFDNSALSFDARGNGYERIQNSTVDKGAFETLAPTAAAVSVSGRVMNGKRGIGRARVYLTGQNGETRTAMTDSFGCFSFSEMPAGETYVFNVISKSYIFTPQVITVNEDLTDLDFSAEPSMLSQQ